MKMSNARDISSFLIKKKIELSKWSSRLSKCQLVIKTGFDSDVAMSIVERNFSGMMQVKVIYVIAWEIKY